VGRLVWNLVEACTCRTDIWKKAECMAKVSLSCRFMWYWVIACNLLYNSIDDTAGALFDANLPFGSLESPKDLVRQCVNAHCRSDVMSCGIHCQVCLTIWNF
jgi:hypothetical protein